MKTILIASFALLLAVPAEAQYQQRITKRQWYQIRARKSAWMTEYYAYMKIIHRFIAEKKIPPMTYEEQCAEAIRLTTEDFGPCPVVPPDPTPSWAQYLPKQTESDRIVEAIEANTRSVEAAGRRCR